MNKSILTIAILLMSYVLFAKENDKNYTNWSDPKPHEEVPADFDQYNAYIIEENYEVKEELTNIPDKPIISYRQLHRRIKILTKDGIDEHAKIIVPYANDSDIQYLDARTIKPNGDVVHFDSNELKKISAIKNEYFERENYMLFAIPGVEVGDEIEVIYKIKNKGIEMYDILYFNSYLPTLHSQIDLIISEGIQAQIQNLNRAPMPEIEKKKNYISIYTWKMDTLKTTLNEEFAIPILELPLIKIRVNGYNLHHLGLGGSMTFATSDSIENVKRLYEYFDKVTDSKKFGSGNWKHYESKLTDLKKETEELHPFARFMKFNQVFLEPLDIKTIRGNKAQGSFGDFIEAKEITREALFSLTEELLDKSGVTYYFCFGKNRYYGIFDPVMFFPEMTNELFFALEDADGTIHFIYPSKESKKYKINEFPHSLEGTEAIMIKKIKKSLIKTQYIELERIIIPSSTYNENFRITNMLHDININENKSKGKNTISFSGAFSTKYRNRFHNNQNEFKTLLQNIDIEKLDTFIVSKINVEEDNPYYPFKFKISVENETDNFLKLIDLEENLFSIELNDYLGHIKLPCNPKNKERKMGYFPMFPYQDVFKIFIKFDSPVELIDQESHMLSEEKNGFGKYTFQVQQLNQTTLMVQSTYLIQQQYLPAKKHSELQKLNETLEKTDASLMIKVL